jgi:hypothetical protein
MEKESRAKEIALESAVLVFLAVALAGVLAGAEAYVAALRALGAGALVAFGGRFPARVVLEAIEPPPESAASEEPAAPEATPRSASAPRRGQNAA